MTLTQFQVGDRVRGVSSQAMYTVEEVYSSPGGHDSVGQYDQRVRALKDGHNNPVTLPNHRFTLVRSAAVATPAFAVGDIVRNKAIEGGPRYRVDGVTPDGAYLWMTNLTYGDKAVPGTGEALHYEKVPPFFEVGWRYKRKSPDYVGETFYVLEIRTEKWHSGEVREVAIGELTDGAAKFVRTKGENEFPFWRKI